MHNKRFLSDDTYQRIKHDILTGAIAPGEQIVQAELAARYEVGTTPVREALLRLAKEGFVTPIPRLGYLVSTVTPHDIEEIYEARVVLEPAVARLAARNATPEQADEILAAANFSYALDDVRSQAFFVSSNRNFHLVIAAASGNQRLYQFVSRILDESVRLNHLGLVARDTRQEMPERHLALAEAIRDHDEDLAERLSRDGVNRWRQIAGEGMERLSRRLPAVDVPHAAFHGGRNN